MRLVRTTNPRADKKQWRSILLFIVITLVPWAMFAWMLWLAAACLYLAGNWSCS